MFLRRAAFFAAMIAGSNGIRWRMACHGRTLPYIVIPMNGIFCREIRRGWWCAAAVDRRASGRERKPIPRATSC